MENLILIFMNHYPKILFSEIFDNANLAYKDNYFISKIYLNLFPVVHFSILYLIHFSKTKT